MIERGTKSRSRSFSISSACRMCDGKREGVCFLGRQKSRRSLDNGGGFFRFWSFWPLSLSPEITGERKDNTFEKYRFLFYPPSILLLNVLFSHVDIMSREPFLFLCFFFAHLVVIHTYTHIHFLFSSFFPNLLFPVSGIVALL